jgi:arylsulfatase A-like enzyme
MKGLDVIFSTTILFFSLSAGCKISEEKKTDIPPNVLFIAVDDLRPELGCYGTPLIKSPNIDRLADQSTVFTRAYCNVPVCGASRASLITSIYPSRTRFLNYFTRASEDTPDAISLPRHFKDHGYYTASLGKVMHHRDDVPQSWSEPAWRPDQRINPAEKVNWRNYVHPESKKIAEGNEDGSGPSWESAPVEDTAYFDGQVAKRGVDLIYELADRDQPFFLAVGFLKPHLPFNAPTKYWDLYPVDQIPLAKNPFMPEKAPEQAWHNSGELRAYTNIPKDRVLPDSISRKLVHGYYACVSYTDAMIGWLLDALEETGLDHNTVVVLWGDHGWSLGEHTLWCKHSCFHNALRVPMIIKDPYSKKGQKTTAFASLLDLYPTLCELANLPIPDHAEGKSLKPILENPATQVQPVIFTRWKSGESIRTDKYLYTSYISKEGEQIAQMLYDHTKDPEENINVVDHPENAELVTLLKQQLEKHVQTVNR